MWAMLLPPFWTQIFSFCTTIWLCFLLLHIYGRLGQLQLQKKTQQGVLLSNPHQALPPILPVPNPKLSREELRPPVFDIEVFKSEFSNVFANKFSGTTPKYGVVHEGQPVTC